MGGLTAKKGLPSPLSKFGCMILYTKPICPWPYGTGLWPWSGPDLAWIWPRSGTDRLVGVSRCQGSCARPSKWSTERTVTWGENKSSGHVDTKSLHRPAVRVAHHLEVHLWSPALSIWNEKKKHNSSPLHCTSHQPVPSQLHLHGCHPSCSGLFCEHSRKVAFWLAYPRLQTASPKAIKSLADVKHDNGGLHYISLQAALDVDSWDSLVGRTESANRQAIWVLVSMRWG